MSIPRDRTFDGTLALLADPYRFIAQRCRRNGSDAFVTRLLLRRAVCVVGEDASRMFYAPDRFTRRDAIPVTALALPDDRESAQPFDETAHRHREQMLQSLMTPPRVAALVDRVEEEFLDRAKRWEARREIVLVRELQTILTRAVCAWAGLSLRDAELRRRTRELSAMYEGAGAVGPRNWRAHALRRRTERWLRAVVSGIRSGRGDVASGSPAEVIAHHRDLDGALLDVKEAATEILDLLRPTVAVERLLTFAALALHQHPACREQLSVRNDAYAEQFVQEVRRVHPYLPMISGRARIPFVWRGRRFAPGDWVLLDVYGTNRDPRSWEKPDEFRPERHAARRDARYSLVPRGGGDPAETQRCAEEHATIEIMKRITWLLASSLDYEVPAQDLTIDMSRIPAVPRSRFRMRDVRLRTPLASVQGGALAS